MSDKKVVRKIEETDDGTILFNVPFPTELNDNSLADLKIWRLSS
jgi:hypothetical protein